MLSDSTNQFVNAFCIHGELGVKVGSQNVYSGSEISMPDLDMLLNGSDNIGVDECFTDLSLPKTTSLLRPDIVFVRDTPCTGILLKVARFAAPDPSSESRSSVACIIATFGSGVR